MKLYGMDVKPRHLDLLVSLSSPSLSPDGEQAVFAARRPSFVVDDYVGRIWSVATAGRGRPRPLTRGTSDLAPQLSPDGRTVAFLRGGIDVKPQLAIVAAEGGEPRIITDAPLGVDEFVWSSDSRKLAFVARMPEEGRYGTLDGVPTDREDPRLIVGNKYQANGLGYTRDRPRGIYLLEVPSLDEEPWLEPRGRAATGTEEEPRDNTLLGGRRGIPRARLLTPMEADCHQPEFTPDGERVYFTAALHAGEDSDLRTMVYEVPVAGGAPVLVVGGPESPQAWSRPRFSRDGRTLFLLTEHLGESGLDFVGRATAIAALDADAKPGTEPRILTDPVTSDYEAPWGFLEPFGQGSVMAPARVRGCGELQAISPEGRIDVLVRGPRVVSAAAEREGVTVAVVSEATHPMELARLAEGRLVRLTDFARPLIAAATPVEPRELTVQGEDGNDIHGWVFVPKGRGPHPVLLNIHGGPFSNFNWAFFDEAQVYVRAGYAVVQCNPRGSASYGQAHGRAVKERMGVVDMADVLAFLDEACSQFKSLDEDRVGIMGGSYGGYLTAWITSHDDRFAAAVVERGYLDPAAFVGTSDIGWFFSDGYVGVDPDGVEQQSPMARVGQVTTPTLVIHSERDLRCPLEQAQRYFAALRRNEVTTRMLVFPGENHELSRSGTPWHRRQRFEAILDWWAEQLPVRMKEARRGR